MKLVEVQSTKEFVSTFLNDIFLKMAVNRVLDAAPGFDLVHCKECVHGVWSETTGMYKCKWLAESDCGFVSYHKTDHYCADGERKET